MNDTCFIFFKVIKATARYTGSSEKTVRNVIKEFKLFNGFVGGPFSRIRKTIFEKLTTEQQDAIRRAVIIISTLYNFLNLLSTSRYTQVHAEMKRCNDKEDDVSYPTTTSLHKAIMKLPEIPWTWRKSTTYDVLMHLGFRQVTASFLSLHLAQFRHVPGILFSIFQVFGHFVSTQ